MTAVAAAAAAAAVAAEAEAEAEAAETMPVRKQLPRERPQVRKPRLKEIVQLWDKVLGWGGGAKARATVTAGVVGSSSSRGATATVGARELEKAGPARRRLRAESMSLLVKSPRKKQAHQRGEEQRVDYR